MDTRGKKIKMIIQTKIRKGNKIYEFIVNITEEEDCKEIISEMNEEKRWFLNEVKQVIEEVEEE
jgi:hypothetical protein